MPDLQITFDTSELTKLLDSAAANTVNALRRAVDRTARRARRETIKVMAADIGRPQSAFSKAVPPVKTTTQSSITATWRISKANIGILKTGSFTPIRSALQGSFSGSTFRATGGGSASLNLPKAFIIEHNGGRVLMVRTGKGRSAIKAIYAEMPNTSMSQDDAAPRRMWTRVAQHDLGANAAAEMQNALNGAQLSPFTSGD